MKSVSTKEFIWYAVSGLIATVGLIFIIFGIIGYNLELSATANFIEEIENNLGIGLRYLGLIFLAVGVVFGIGALMFNAKKADREVEKKIRREQRIAAQSSQTLEVKSAVNYIEETQK